MRVNLNNWQAVFSATEDKVFAVEELVRKGMTEHTARSTLVCMREHGYVRKEGMHGKRQLWRVLYRDILARYLKTKTIPPEIKVPISITKEVYSPTEDRTYYRPGSLTAFSLPSKGIK